MMWEAAVHEISGRAAVIIAQFRFDFLAEFKVALLAAGIPLLTSLGIPSYEWHC